MMMMTMIMMIVDDDNDIENDDDNDGELLLACHQLCLLGSTQSLLRFPNQAQISWCVKYKYKCKCKRKYKPIDQWKIF